MKCVQKILFTHILINLLEIKKEYHSRTYYFQPEKMLVDKNNVI